MARRPAIGILDLGASGGRLFVLALENYSLRMFEIYRFAHSPQRYWQTLGGSKDKVVRLCWDLGRMLEELLEGLGRIARRADLDLKSFGVDTWGSDGMWINASGDILGLVGTGRDRRWEIACREISRRVSKKELFRLTGTRSEPFCVLNQLYWYVYHEPRLVEAATTYMPINSLFHYYLCGEKVAEYTWMSTTQLSAPGQARYHADIFAHLQLPLHKMPPLVRPGFLLGPCHAELAESVGLPPFEIIVPATHDTACAYAAAPVEARHRPILVSSGTWTLVGTERQTPLISDEVYTAGLTNIAGCEGIYLQAVSMGSWPAQALRTAWGAQDGRTSSWESFGQLASAAPPLKTLLDIDDPIFYTPQNMEAAIVEFCRWTGQHLPKTREAMARAVYEGLALKTALACDKMQAVAAYRADEIVIVGGGSRSTLLNQWIADAAGLPVRAGSVNATALGNGLIQARALGWLRSLEEGRTLLRQQSEEQVFQPRVSHDWAGAKQRIEHWQRQRTAH